MAGRGEYLGQLGIVVEVQSRDILNILAHRIMYTIFLKFLQGLSKH
jgi:hypothetical protein